MNPLFGCFYSTDNVDLNENWIGRQFGNLSGHNQLCTEMGGSGMVSPKALKICCNGVNNMLHHLGIFAATNNTDPVAKKPLLYGMNGAHSYVRASEVGVFEPFNQLNDKVRSGQAAGRIHFPGNPEREPLELSYGVDGMIYGLRQPGRVTPGNCCLLVAPRQKRLGEHALIALCK